MNAGLTYSWTLPDGSALPFTPTPSADPRKLIIPPSTLALGSSYTLRLNTVASNSVGVSTGYADVIITNVTAVRTRRLGMQCALARGSGRLMMACDPPRCQQVPVVAKIAGASELTVADSKSFVLDGRPSYDPNNATKVSDHTFSWSCATAGDSPVACTLGGSYVPPTSALITVPASALGPGQ